MAAPLSGRVALVTGAARGIGHAVALGLAEAGASVICAARTGQVGSGALPGSIEETVAAIRSRGGIARGVAADLSEPEGVARTFAAVDAFGQLDAVVHAAMSRVTAPIEELSPSDWRTAVTANLDALLLVAQRSADRLAAGGGGDLVLVGSAMADRDRPVPGGYLGYAVTKAATERFATALAAEVAGRAVRVHLLRPGRVRTEIAEQELGPRHDWSGWRRPQDVVPDVLALLGVSSTSAPGTRPLS